MTITVKITEETKKAMDEFYKDLVRPKTPQYALFQADDGDTVVTLYESGKAVFQGKDADLASQYWIETEKINAGTVHYTNSDEKGKKEKKEIKTVDMEMGNGYGGKLKDRLNWDIKKSSGYEKYEKDTKCYCNTYILKTDKIILGG